MTAMRQDRRAQRTYRALQEALAELIIERGWDDISVQDICDRADVGRSTFYMHFSGKERLLARALENSRQEIRARQSAGASGMNELLPFARGMLAHMHERQHVFRAIGKRSGYVVQRHFREMIAGMVKEDLTAAGHSGWRSEATAHYLAGAFVELLVWWMDAGSARRPAEIEQLFDQLTVPAIEGLRTARPVV